MITSNLFEDTFIAHLSPFERLLWIGLIVAGADDQGRMLDHATLLRAKIFLFDAEVNETQIECGLAKLAQAKKITRYTAADGSPVIQIVKWWRHQNPAWAAPSIYPAPPEWQDRIRCHGQGNQIILFEWEGRGGYIRGYTGRYVGDNVDDYVPDYVDDYVSGVGSPIDEVKIKEEVKIKDEDEDELCAVIGGNAPVPLAPPPSPSSSPVQEPLLSGVDVSPGERLSAKAPSVPTCGNTGMAGPGFLGRGGFGWIRTLIRAGAKPTPASPERSFPLERCLFFPRPRESVARSKGDLDFPRLPKFSETSEVLMRTFAYSEGIRTRESERNHGTDPPDRVDPLQMDCRQRRMHSGCLPNGSGAVFLLFLRYHAGYRKNTPKFSCVRSQ
jgi:hypothetical protein